MSIKCVKIEPTNEVDKLLYDTFTSPLKPGWLEVGELKTCLPVKYLELVEEVDNFDVREDDIFVAAHPRTGSFWTQEMVWLIANNCDFEGAKTKMTIRWPFLEGAVHLADHIHKKLMEDTPEIDYIPYANSLKVRPRCIKTHHPYNLLPKKIRENQVQPKIIYITRNPKDVCVSFYHLSRTLNEFFGSFDDFCKLFLGGRAYYGPFWSHVFSYWNRQHLPNILIINYESMLKDLPSVIKKVADFLDKTITDQQISELAEHLSFEKHKKNQHANLEKEMKYLRSLLSEDPNCEKLVRKGKAGSFKEEMSAEMIQKFNEWIAENTEGTDLKFE